jgi:hypothetical protein
MHWVIVVGAGVALVVSVVGGVIAARRTGREGRRVVHEADAVRAQEDADARERERRFAPLRATLEALGFPVKDASVSTFVRAPGTGTATGKPALELTIDASAFDASDDPSDAPSGPRRYSPAKLVLRDDGQAFPNLKAEILLRDRLGDANRFSAKSDHFHTVLPSEHGFFVKLQHLGVPRARGYQGPYHGPRAAEPVEIELARTLIERLGDRLKESPRIAIEIHDVIRLEFDLTELQSVERGKRLVGLVEEIDRILHERWQASATARASTGASS